MTDWTNNPRCNCNDRYDPGKKKMMVARGMFYVCSTPVAKGGCGKIINRNTWDREQEQKKKM